MPFKFLNNTAEYDPLYDLDVYQNMTLGLISYCRRMNIDTFGWKHHFYECGTNPEILNGVNKCLVLLNIATHDRFETPHVMIQYNVNTINRIGDANYTETTEHTFHLDKDVFDNVMRRYENL